MVCWSTVDLSVVSSERKSWCGGERGRRAKGGEKGGKGASAGDGTERQRRNKISHPAPTASLTFTRTHLVVLYVPLYSLCERDRRLGDRLRCLMECVELFLDVGEVCSELSRIGRNQHCSH